MITRPTLIEFLEKIASDHDLIGNLAPDGETRQRHRRAALKLRKLVERVVLKSDQFKLERTIALSGQSKARRYRLIARNEQGGFVSKETRERAQSSSKLNC